MSETKRVLNFSIENTDQLVNIVENLTELKVDLDVDSTPSSIEISVYGPEHKVRSSEEKIRKIVRDAKSP